jgi:MoxR-like ATPase
MSDGGKRNKLPQLVIRALIDGGKTIEQIASQQNLKNVPAGDPDQIQHQSKSIWHNKAEIDNYVRDKLNISDSEWYAGDSNRPSNWYTFVAQEISKLREDGTITDWNPELRTGIWRLTHLKGISSVDPALQSNTLNVDSDDSSSKRFFIALGPWSNWDHTIQNPPFRWGVNPSSASNVGVFNALRVGDVVYYYANQDNPRKFSNRGLFGVGIVTRIYDEDHERYWPDEKLKDEVIYKHRFEIKSLKLVTADSGLLPWIDGLPFTKGLNRVANEETLKQLIDSTEKIWNIDFKSFNSVDDTNSSMKDHTKELPIISAGDIDDGYDLISKELLIPKEKIIEIITALLSGRHILLAGPIGTGKTALATLIPKIFWKRWGGYDSEIVTANSEWSTLDVIAGILPKMGDDGEPKYVIEPGCVVDTVRKNSQIHTNHSQYSSTPYMGTWLVIDEFNRANIDKAFGQLFTALRTRELKIPTDKVNVKYDHLPIQKDYRIIGTLNTADKHHLFNLSDALKSRFAYIELDIPKKGQREREIYFTMKNAVRELGLDESTLKIFLVLDHNNKKIDKSTDDKFYARIFQAYEFLDTVRIFKKLGPAVLQLIYQNLITGVQLRIDNRATLDTALTSTLIPQLENLESSSIGAIHAMHTDTLDSFFKDAYKDLNKLNYVETFETVLISLNVSDDDKNRIISKFENDALPDDDGDWKIINDAFDKKKESIAIKLEHLSSALLDLKKSTMI